MVLLIQTYVRHGLPNSPNLPPGPHQHQHRKITTARSEQRMVRDIMVYLHSHGVSTSRASPPSSGNRKPQCYFWEVLVDCHKSHRATLALMRLAKSLLS